jgi:hypothetical protein
VPAVELVRAEEDVPAIDFDTWRENPSPVRTTQPVTVIGAFVRASIVAFDPRCDPDAVVCAFANPATASAVNTPPAVNHPGDVRCILIPLGMSVCTTGAS